MMNVVIERICTYIINITYIFYRCSIYIFRFFIKKTVFVLRNLFENLILYEILKFEKAYFLD